jgi:hypothetical protein
MRKISLVLLCVCFYNSTIAQDSSLLHFYELVDKVQREKTPNGTFMFKGFIAEVSEYKGYKTTSVRYTEINWMLGTQAQLSGIFHRTLGYMTRGLFNMFKLSSKFQKISRNKYCKDRQCFELRDDKKLPYIVQYSVWQSEKIE